MIRNTAKNCQNGYDAKKHIVSKLTKISIPNKKTLFDDLIKIVSQFTSLSLILSKK